MASEITAVPHSPEAEMAVLGSVIVEPEVLEAVACIVKPEDFFDSRHAAIFAAMQSVGHGIDQVTVTEELRRKGKLEAKRHA